MLESVAKSRLNSARYPPLELLGIVELKGAMKKAIPSPELFSLVTLSILKVKWVMKSVRLLVLGSHSCTSLSYEALPELLPRASLDLFMVSSRAPRELAKAS